MQTAAVKFKDIKTLTLADFMECLINHVYLSLIEQGSPTDDELKAAWDSIYLDYIELTVGTTEYKAYQTVLRQFTEAHSRYLALISGIQALSLGYSKEVVDGLAELGYPIELKENDIKNYTNELKKLDPHIKGAELILKQAKKDIDEYTMGRGKEMTEAMYHEYIAAVSKFMGFQISLTTSLIQWISYTGLMNKYNKIQDNGRRTDR